MEKTSEEKVKMEGTVKFFNKLKGFGFVKGDDERDYFVHITAIEQGKYLQEGDRVSFDGIEDEKGLKAQNIKFLSKGAPLEEESGEESSEEEQPAEEEAPAEESAEEETPAEEPREEEAPAEEEKEEEKPEEESEAEETPAEEPAEEEAPAEESDEEKKEE